MGRASSVHAGDVNDWEGDSLQGSPNPSEVEQLLGKSRISSDLPQWMLGLR